MKNPSICIRFLLLAALLLGSWRAPAGGSEGDVLPRSLQEDEGGKDDGENKNEPGEKKDGGGKEGKRILRVGILGKRLEYSDFYEFTYTVPDGKKTIKKKALVLIPADVEAFEDRRGKAEDFDIDDKVQILASPQAHTGRDPTNQVDVTVRFFKSIRLVFAGDRSSVHTGFKDAEDKSIRWTSGVVTGTGKVLTVDCEGKKFSLSIDKKTPILFRRKVDKPQKAVKPKTMLVVQGVGSEEKPPYVVKDAAEGCFRAVRIIQIDASLASSYGSMLALEPEKE